MPRNQASGWKCARAIDTALDATAVRATAAALAAEGFPSESGHVAFGTDAGVFERAGIPGIVIGPGSISAAQTARESVPIAEVETMVRIFERLLEGAEAPVRD